MAIIHIDGKTYEVDGAENLLQTCLSLGLDLPYFCYHPALGSVGSCRQCAVKQYDNADDYHKQGRGRLVMSCMVNPTNDMYISISDAEAKNFRKSMVEFLMTNHPHDCPTCEEGGHCHLQDMTYMSGHNHRRYRFTKRTHHNQDLGAFINHEMNRCIACYRCVRYYKDYAGGEDLGVYASASRVYFGRDKDGQFESEFSGNLTEICPTGVFTDKTHSDRYNRKWDMQYAPSICHGCSSGCNISAGERYGELRRIENRYHGEVNGYFLCDKGRFGYGYVNRKDRHIQAREQINGKQEIIHLDYAIDSVKQRLMGKKMIGIGSPIASLESNFTLKQLVGAGNFSTGLSKKEQKLIDKCIEILTTEGIYNPSMLEIESYDAVLILGEDITQTASRVALSVRQAAKNKAKEMSAELKTFTWLAEPVKRIGQNECSPIFVIDVKETKLDDIAKVSCVATPNDIVKLGFEIAHYIQHSDGDVLPKDLVVIDGDNQQMSYFAKHIAQTLLKAKKPLIISGTALQSISVIESAAEIAQQLTQKRQAILQHEQKIIQLHNAKVAEETANNPETKTPMMSATTTYIAQTGLYLSLPYANGVGVSLLGGLAIDDVLSQSADVLVVMENDLSQILTPSQLQQLFVNKTLIVLDHQQYVWHKQADVLLPVATFAEADGTLVSAEGRAQRFFQVYDPTYYNPHNMVKESWRWLHAIDSELHHQGIVWTQLDDIVQVIAKNYPQLSGITKASPTADYRISGLKIAREPRRYSGRTAMRANLSIHEPQQPVDKDTGLAFSMEGYVGNETDSSMIPFAWSAGWNSPQAWNKYQDKVGGHLKQGDPGVRLFDILPRLPRRQYVANLVDLSSDIQLVPIYNMFASSAYASRSEVVASQLIPAVFSVCADDAKLWGIEDKQLLTLNINDEIVSLPVQVVDYLAENCIGYPVGQAATICTLLNQMMGKVVVKIAHVGEQIGEGA